MSDQKVYANQDRTPLQDSIEELKSEMRLAREELSIVKGELVSLTSFVKDQLRHDLSKKFLTVALDNMSDVRRFWELDATRATYEYVAPMLAQGEVKLFSEKKPLLEFAARSISQDGLLLEFGVAWGRSINVIAATTPRTIHGFDSFEGLPEDWGVMASKGAFKQEKLPSVAPNVALHVGLFSDTLPLFLEQHRGPISLLHLDADLYSSTSYVLTEAADRIAPGSIIIFDEYFNYPNWQNGEFRAWREFVDAHRVTYRYLAFNCFGRNLGQAVIRVESRG